MAEAFWNREVEDELRKWEWIDRLHVWSREDIMVIDKERASTVYPHEQCSDECKKRPLLTHYAKQSWMLHTLRAQYYEWLYTCAHTT